MIFLESSNKGGRDGRGTCHVLGKTRSKYRILLGKSEGDKPLGKHRQRCDDNIKMDLKETRWVRVGWTYVAQDKNELRAFVKTVTNLGET